MAYVDLRRRRESRSRREPEASRRRAAPDPLFLLASGFAAGCLASFFVSVFLSAFLAGPPGSPSPAFFLLLAVISLLVVLLRAVRRLPGRVGETAAPGAGSEKQLLMAIQDAGGVTPVEAALETSLTVDEAEEALTRLADRGHLVVRSRAGALVYALPGGHSPGTL